MRGDSRWWISQARWTNGDAGSQGGGSVVRLNGVARLKGKAKGGGDSPAETEKVKWGEAGPDMVQWGEVGGCDNAAAWWRGVRSAGTDPHLAEVSSG
jgi:hypothetical protein